MEHGVKGPVLRCGGAKMPSTMSAPLQVWRRDRSHKLPLGRAPVILGPRSLEIPIQATSTRAKSITKLPNPASPLVLWRKGSQKERGQLGILRISPRPSPSELTIHPISLTTHHHHGPPPNRLPQRRATIPRRPLLLAPPDCDHLLPQPLLHLSPPPCRPAAAPAARPAAKRRHHAPAQDPPKVG